MFNTPGQVFMIIAPSGAGKSSLVNALLQEDPSIKLSISTTTRTPRPGEVNGREYHFVAQEDFQSCLNDNGFLEWAEVHGNFYGTPLSWIKEQVTAGQDILLEIDWQGAQQVRQRYPSVIDIFILPPSIKALEERLYKRGQDSEDVIARRLLAAGSEISHASECEYVIINETFQDALNELKLIIAAARLRFVAQYARHRDFFSELGITQRT